MNFVNMLTRRDPLKRAFVTLEDGMTDVLNEEFMLPSEPETLEVDGMPSDLDAMGAEVDMADDTTTPVDLAGDDNGERVTPHTQGRLAGYAAFDEARARANQELTRIGEALANIMATNNLNREFLNDCYADIHRSNELELANAAYAADNRRLNERVEKLEKLRARYDQLIDVLKRREAKLIQDAETQREVLGAVRLESIEARNTLTRNETQIGELQASLAAKTAEAERFMRDAEMLREKTVGLTLDLDMAQKKQADTRRKLEDLTAIHASDSARLAEITARLTSEENETTRLQKTVDQLEAKLIEANESVTYLTGEVNERDKRHQAESLSLRNEVQAVSGRLQHAVGEQRDMLVELNEARSRASDLESERMIIEKKFAALSAEIENERRLYVAQAGLAAPQDAEAAEQQRRENEQMRDEINALKSSVEQLRQYETLYAAAKARAKAKSEVASGFSVSNGKIVPDFSPAKPIARRA